MQNNNAGKPAVKLNLSKIANKKKLKRKTTVLHEQAESIDIKPSKQVQKNIPYGNKDKPKHSDLNSFLEALPETTGGDNIDPPQETDGDQHFIESKTIDTKQNQSTKLDKIKSTYSQHPFTKQLYHPIAQEDTYYRGKNGIHVDFGAQESESLSKYLMPITAWHSAGLPLPMMRVLESHNYHEPTPIQAQSLPIIMSGYDMLGIAPTGSGKTAAFLIPLCRHVAANMNANSKIGHRGPFALILVPTRELCIQIQRELQPWADSLQLHTLGCYGGSDISSQISALVNNRCHIAVATPGRLIDLLSANNGRVMSLGAVTFFVVDETDRMFDLGFGPQVRKAIESIRPDRQTVVFSATMPQQLEGIVKRILNKPIKVRVLKDSNFTDSSANRNSSIPLEVDQKAFVLEDGSQKLQKLVEILRNFADNLSVIVFVNTQTLADSLALQLSRVNIICRSLHGGMDQQDRDDAINEFRNGQLHVLVATSVAARGLDVKNLKLVVNYDPASHPEDYIHRAGRTGRAGESGECISLLLPNEGKEAFYLANFFQVNEQVKSLAANYLAAHPHENNIKKFKWAGFGGHGLDKLDAQRHLKRTIERDAYTTEDTPLESTLNAEVNKIIKIGNEAFSAKLIINDIPRESRIAVTAVEKQVEIMEKFHVSLTSKGTYYSNPKPGIDDEMKLHLQIEGGNRDEVAQAYSELLEFINQKNKDVKPQGKFSTF